MMKSYNYRLEAFLATVVLLLFQACEKDQQKTKEEFISESVEQISADSLESYVQWLENMGTRFMLADNHRQVASGIKQKFINLGYPNTVLDSFYVTSKYAGEYYQTWQYNVIATCRGVFSENISVIGAHYDNYLKSGDPFTFVPGANDNASGIAAMLEIARLIHSTSFSPLYTIRFVAFAGEEFGFYGSLDYCDKARKKNEEIIMMLNNDMIAGQPDPLYSSWPVYFVNYKNATGLLKDAERNCLSYTSLASYNDTTLAARSDSYPFYRYGYEPIFFTQGSSDNNYHTANDIASACNFEFCREVTKISYALLLEKNYWK